MAYFNGELGYTYKGTVTPEIPCTAVYCDDCGETQIPLPPRNYGTNPFADDDDGIRHHGTGFRWAGNYSEWTGTLTNCSSCGIPA